MRRWEDNVYLHKRRHTQTAAHQNSGIPERLREVFFIKKYLSLPFRTAAGLESRRTGVPMLPILLLFAVCSLLCFDAHAACHVATASGAGSKNGSDWSNAFAKLPATLVRGDVYYLADGSYGAYSFNTSLSGTQIITIKKATAADHCTDTGWNAGSMGSSRAVFTQWAHGGGGYYTLDGQTGVFNGNGLPAAGSFGIFLDGTSCHSGTLGRCVPLDMPSASNVTVSHVEIQGTGATSSANTNTPDDLLYWGGSSNLTLDHAYLHDSSCDFTFGYGGSGLTIQYSFFYKNWGTGACHGQALWSGSSVSNVTFRFNTFRTIEGSAIWTAATAGGGTTLSNWQIYGNVIYFGGSADKSDYQCLGDGVFACLNSGVSCTNIQFYNNTIASLPGAGQFNCGAGASGIYGDPSSNGGSFIVENNLWYGNSSGTGFGPKGTFTESHNSFLSNPGGSGDGSNDVAASGNPFASWSGSGNGNFHLSGENTNWSGGAALSTPYTTDPDGATRGADGTWDRGAYEFNSGAPPPPPPPSGSACDVNGDSATNVVDVQQEVNQALGIANCTADINKDGQCTVVDVQRVVNAALGGQCVTP
jgi:hypothetical protein